MNKEITPKTLGSYEIREEVGRGGMATVYKAYQPNMDRDVAIKVILKSLDRHEEAVQRFQREARLIARLEYPHILPVYDFDGGHDPPYIVMRYLDGGTLKDILRQGLLPLHEVSYLIQQVGTALDYAHRQGIVHRDVKPSNILVDREGNAFVTDFGIARMVAEQSSGDQITGTGVIVGTPDYMAPEQIMGVAQVDHRADIYALGVIFFQMITGHLPYTSDNPAGLLVQHLQGEIPIATALNDDLPEEADVIIRRTLAKDPDERYLSALAMANAVTGALGGIVSSRPAKLGQAAGESMIVRRLGPELSDTGSSKTPSEQNKNITALYANSSEYSEIIDEILGGEESRKAVRALWESAEVVVDEYGGLITSSTDDTMLAIWGADTTREDDAERAVRAALAIRNSLTEAMQDLIDEDLDEEPLPLDIGINTGIALLSPMDDGRQVTASGATIGLTNRLMQQARGAVLITHETYTQVRGVFDVEPDTPLRMRRSRRSIKTYRVMVIKPRAFHLHTRGIEGVETQMVGRDAELKSLQNAFLDAVEEEGTQMVSVISEPGLGKSRLLYEFSNWAELRPERYWILRGRPTPEMTGRPYSLLRDIISFRYEILDSDESHVVRGKLEEGLRKQIGPNEEMAHLLGHLAGFELDDSPFIQGLQGDPQQLTNRAKKLFEEWLIDLAEVNPVVIELEDLHFSDDATLDLFSGFVSNNEESRVLLVCLARPELYERRARWGVGLPFHLRIDLRPLDRRESRSLVREILTNISQVPKNLRDLLVDRAEGNPFYLEELVKMLIDDRVIIKDSEDLWRVEESRIGHLEVPGTLTGLLQARLDNLLYPEKLTLQRAAVIGRVFYDSALAVLDSDDETHLDDLPEILDRLVSSEFIYPRATTAFEGSREYIFSGQMIQDVLLSTLLQRQRQTYNRSAAEWLIDASGHRVDEYSGLVADYYERAGENEAAAQFLHQAGRRSLNISAYDDALRQLKRAVELTPIDHSDRSALQVSLGQAYFFASDPVQAKIALLETQKAAEKLGQDQLAADALYWSSQVSIQEGSYQKANKKLGEALEFALKADVSETVARVTFGLGDLHWRLNQLDEARAFIDESFVLAQKIADPHLEIRALNRLGTIESHNRNWDRANELLSLTLDKAQQLGDRELAGTALNNLGYIASEIGDEQLARDYASRALPIARETGNLQALAIFTFNMAESDIRHGDLDSAKDLMLESLTAARRIGAVPPMLFVIHLAGWIEALDGDQETGLAYMGFCLNHRASTEALSHNVRQKLAFLNLDPDDPEIQRAMESGKELELEEVCALLFEEYSSSE